MARSETNKSIYDACRQENSQRVHEYLTKGGCVTEKDDHHMTMLHHLAFAGNTELIKLLFSVSASQNVDVDAQDRDGWTPLHYACDRGHTSSASVLLDEGASASSRDGSKRTPLHLAALGNHSQIITLLLAHGASKLAKNAAGLTPLECAKAAGSLTVVSLLE